MTVNDSVSCITVGSLTAGHQYIATSANGTFSQAGGTNSFYTELSLGYAAEYTGTYSLYNGLLASATSKYYQPVDSCEYVGYSGTGVFNQFGGTNFLVDASGNGKLYLGYNYGSSGTYKMSGSAYLTADAEIIGEYGTGSFFQNGGTNSVGCLTLGHCVTLDNDSYRIFSSGSYTLSGNSYLSVGSEIIGAAGRARSFRPAARI